MQKKLIQFFLFVIFFGSIYNVNAQPKNEFRGVWIATVSNIDWPLSKDYNTASQKAEFIRQLDLHKKNGMNAVIVQVRPSADAFYPSPFEPWSQWLTGTQGKAPVPYYDPLQFMIEETHKRGMEFHAWANPYRANFNTRSASIAANHPTRTNPEWFVTYGDKKYFDPGNKEAQKFVVKVIRDMVKRYNIDAVHMDDYFYPYRIPGREFPDASSYRKYGNGMAKDEWRRSNVDSIIVALSKAIKEERSDCRFGISPFGVWRNKSVDPDGSDTKAGVTNYDDLYADILLWLKNDWIDYVAPQLYWEIGHPLADYEVLLDWWANRTFGKHCYIGIGIYRAGSNAAWRDKTQLPRMIEMLRKYPQVQGAIYYSSKIFKNNPNGWNDSLQDNYYKHPAIVPPMSWIGDAPPPQPVVKTTFDKKTSTLTTSFFVPVDENIRSIAIYRLEKDKFDLGAKNVHQLIPYSTDARFVLKVDGTQKEKGYQYFVTAVNKNNVESEAQMLFSFVTPELVIGDEANATK